VGRPGTCSTTKARTAYGGDTSRASDEQFAPPGPPGQAYDVRAGDRAERGGKPQ
jgi:hypothetical protein